MNTIKKKARSQYTLRTSEYLGVSDALIAMRDAEDLVLMAPGAFTPVVSVGVHQHRRVWKSEDIKTIGPITNTLPIETLPTGYKFSFNGQKQVISASKLACDWGLTFQEFVQLLPSGFTVADAKYYTVNTVEKLPMVRTLIGWYHNATPKYMGLYAGDKGRPYHVSLNSDSLAVLAPIIMFGKHTLEYIDGVKSQYREILYWESVLRRSASVFESLEDCDLSNQNRTTLGGLIERAL